MRCESAFQVTPAQAYAEASQATHHLTGLLQGYLAHKNPPHTLGRYCRPVPGALGGSWGGGLFFISEVPLYLSWPRETKETLTRLTIVAINFGIARFGPMVVFVKVRSATFRQLLKINFREFPTKLSTLLGFRTKMLSHWG